MTSYIDRAYAKIQEVYRESEKSKDPVKAEAYYLLARRSEAGLDLLESADYPNSVLERKVDKFILNIDHVVEVTKKIFSD